MSRIFLLKGNFKKNRKWSNGFLGRIVVNDNNEFYGYCDGRCDELHSVTPSFGANWRYLTGALAKNGRNGRQGIAFYKLSNEDYRSPIIYVVPDLEIFNCGSWSAMDCDRSFQLQGEASIIVEEIPFTEEDQASIKAIFDGLNKEIDWNSDFAIRSAVDCKEALLKVS